MSSACGLPSSPQWHTLSPSLAMRATTSPRRRPLLLLSEPSEEVGSRVLVRAQGCGLLVGGNTSIAHSAFLLAPLVVAGGGSFCCSKTRLTTIRTTNEIERIEKRVV